MRLGLNGVKKEIVNGTEALDYALVSNIIPQLWGANSIFLESLKALCTENLGVYFKEKFDDIKKEEIPNFRKYAKQLEFFNKWYKDMKVEKNYFFPTIEAKEESKKLPVDVFEKMIKAFSKGEKFEYEVERDTLSKVIQGQKIKQYQLEFFKRALDDEIKQSDFND